MTGHWLAFFAVQAPILVAESYIKKLAKKYGVTMPSWLSVLLFIPCMLFLADLFFFPPIYRDDLHLNLENAITDNCRNIVHMVQQIL